MESGIEAGLQDEFVTEFTPGMVLMTTIVDLIRIVVLPQIVDGGLSRNLIKIGLNKRCDASPARFLQRTDHGSLDRRCGMA